MDFDRIYSTLFHELATEQYDSMAETNQFFAQKLEVFAKEMGIARFTVDELVLYEDTQGEPDEKGKFSSSYRNSNRTVTIITAWPCKNVSWTATDKERIKLLQETFYVFGGRAKMIDMIRTAETTDKLTGIPNAAGIHPHGNRLFAAGRGGEFGSFFVNIKNFKLINRRFGSAVGDIILKQFGEFLLKSACLEGEMAARLGGDNFLMIVRQEHSEEIERLLKSFEASAIVDGQLLHVPVTAKAGYVGIGECATFQESLNWSSIAMMYAKSSHENIVHFRPEMLEKTLHDKEVSEKFKSALANREFITFYQPKVSAVDGTICGCEALARWNSESGMIYPKEFIPTLEKEGSICLLDFYILDMACRHIKQWISKGLTPVPVSVNFSKRHLKNKNTAEQIIATIGKYNIPNNLLEIELTEMSDADDFGTMLEFSARLREAGISTSIDDFGTGYSSMTLLRDLPVDVVKLDRSFVINLEKGESKDRIMLESVIHLVKAFGMEVLVEGVETVSQYEYLKIIGVDVIQGYLFDKPINYQAFTEKLKNPVYNIAK